MKIIIISFSLLLINAILFAQTEIGGIYDTNTVLTLSNSPYILVSSINVRGSVLSIESGVEIKLDGNPIYIDPHFVVDDGSIVSYTSAAIIADGVTFTGNGYIQLNKTPYDLPSDVTVGGTISNCSFENVKFFATSNTTTVISNCILNNISGYELTAFALSSGSKVTVENCTIKNYNYPFYIQNDTQSCEITNPKLIGNNISECNNEAILYSARLVEDFTLIDYGYPYHLYGLGIEIWGCSLTIPNSMSIGLNEHNIKIDPHFVVDDGGIVSYTSAAIIADGVTFTGNGYIQLNGTSHDLPSDVTVGGTISNCSFENVKFFATSNTTTVISNCILNNISGYELTAFALSSGSKVTVENCTIKNYNYPFYIQNDTQSCEITNPKLIGNNISECNNEAILYSARLVEDFTLIDYGYPYHLYGLGIEIWGCSLTIPNSMSIGLNEHNIKIDPHFVVDDGGIVSYTSAAIIADGVTFTGNGYIQLNGTSHDLPSDVTVGGTISNCSFENVKFFAASNTTTVINNCSLNNTNSFGNFAFYFSGGSTVTVENCIIGNFINGIVIAFNGATPNIINSDFLNINDYGIENNSSYSISAVNNYWGHETGPTHTSNPSGQGCKVSDNVDFNPWANELINTDKINTIEVVGQTIKDNLKAELEENEDQNLLQKIFDSIVKQVPGGFDYTTDVDINFEFSNNESILDVKCHVVSPDDPNYEEFVKLNRNEDGSFSENIKVQPLAPLDVNSFFDLLGYFAKGASLSPFPTQIGITAPKVIIDRIDLTLSIGASQTIEVDIELPRYDRYIEEQINKYASLGYTGFTKYEMFSPADILIEDESGKKLGVSEGTHYLEIPNSVSTGDDEPEVIALFGNDEYDLFIFGTGEGTFDLHYFQTEMGNDNIGNFIIYEDVPVTPSMICSTSVSYNSENYNLFVDIQGDGTFDSTIIPTSVTDIEETFYYNVIIYEFSLQQNYPNPFNPTTKINYALPKASFVTLKIFDLLGKEIVTLIDRTQQSGRYDITFDASKLPSGMYIYQLVAGNFNQSKKMILIK